MPFLETPPNPVDEPKPVRLRSSRFGDLDEHELVHLLDTLDDERSKARFRESIYIALFAYIVFGLILNFGLRILPHEPRIINPINEQKSHEMATLETPRDIAKRLPHQAPPVQQPAVKPAPPPPTAAIKAPPVQKPLPQAPKPQAAPPPATQAQPVPNPALPQPQAPRPAPPALASIPDAPKAAPNFANQNRSAGSTIRDAVQGAAHNRNGGGEYTNSVTPSGAGVGTGVDILSDTMGVDFQPYLNRIMRQIYNTWIPLIPEEARPPLNKQGVTQLRITIMPDGRLHVQDGQNNGLVLEGSTHDDALNRAAWGSITGVGQFPPLPKEFHGPSLILRIHYLVNQKQE